MNSAKKYPDVDIDTKWFKAKFKDHDLSQSEVARRLGVDRSVVSLILSGKRKLHPEEAVTVAGMLGATWREVMAHAGQVPADRVQVKLWGVVDGEGQIGTVSESTQVPRPGDMTGELLAVQCRAPKGDMALFDGWIFYSMPGNDVPPAAIGRLCLLRKRGFKGKGQIAFCEKGYKSGRFNLVSLGKNTVETDADVEFARPVVWIRAGS